MNEFLELIKTYLKSNPTLINDNLDNFLYTQLIYFNMGHNQQPFQDVQHFFGSWIERNRFNPNLNTFVNPKWPYFCQFVYSKEMFDPDNAIKLYIPLDELHLYEGANRLFDFIATHKIEHNSKIGRRVRNDNIVVRVANLNDAEKIINFVQNEPFIKEGLMNVNPFTINVGGVGVAKDGRYSYNDQLCKKIAELIRILVVNDRLDDLNIKSLQTYLEQLTYEAEDLKVINDLQKNIISGEKIGLNEFKNIINGVQISNISDRVLRNAVITTFNKYGLNHAIAAIERYSYNGNAVGFTRDNNMRSDLKRYVSIEDINNILSGYSVYNGNVVDEYMKSIINDLCFYLIDAYRETLIKHGKEQAVYALTTYIKTGNANYITNNNSVRNTLLENVSYKRISEMLKIKFNLESSILEDELINLFLNEIELKIY